MSLLLFYWQCLSRFTCMLTSFFTHLSLPASQSILLCNFILFGNVSFRFCRSKGLLLVNSGTGLIPSVFQREFWCLNPFSQFPHIDACSAFCVSVAACWESCCHLTLFWVSSLFSLAAFSLPCVLVLCSMTAVCPWVSKRECLHALCFGAMQRDCCVSLCVQTWVSSCLPQLFHAVCLRVVNKCISRV